MPGRGKQIHNRGGSRVIILQKARRKALCHAKEKTFAGSLQTRNYAGMLGQHSMDLEDSKECLSTLVNQVKPIIT